MKAAIDALSGERWRELYPQVEPRLPAATREAIDQGRDPRSFLLVRSLMFDLLEKERKREGATA
jgi:hypothetical protein